MPRLFSDRMNISLEFKVCCSETGHFIENRSCKQTRRLKHEIRLKTTLFNSYQDSPFEANSC